MTDHDAVRAAAERIVDAADLRHNQGAHERDRPSECRRCVAERLIREAIDAATRAQAERGRNGGCQCAPPGSGEEHCTGHCELRAQVAALRGEVERLRAALGLMMQAFDPNWPGACFQECFDTSDGHGYEMQELAKDTAREALAAAPGGQEGAGA